MDIDYIVENDLYLGVVEHDWSAIKEDKKMKRTAAILEYARKNDVEIMHYKEFHRRVCEGEIKIPLKSK